MVNKIIFSAVIVLILVFFLTGFSLLNRPIIENDEGIYWASFLLAEKGNSLYEQISFSQLPGFYLAVYPFFNNLGSSLASARFGTLFWPVISLISLFWFGFKNKNLIFSLISIILIVAVPVFFSQSITLQSDVIAASFSLLSFVSLLTFTQSSAKRNSKKYYLPLLLAGLFFAMAVLNKFDITLSLVIIYLLLRIKKNKYKNIFYFFAAFLIPIIVCFFIFDFRNILTNVITLREKAASIFGFDPMAIFIHLFTQPLLFSLLVINFAFLFLKKKKNNLYRPTLIWFIASLLFVLTLRPIFSHHLVLLVIPTVLLFVNQILSLKVFSKYLNKYGYKLAIPLVVTTFFVGAFSFIANIIDIQKSSNSNEVKEREIARNFINKYSTEKDMIITDEAALYGITNRLPPPELVDLSEVQIRSGNITEDKFKSLINNSKPKLIIVWNGRLKPLGKLIESLKEYRKIELTGRKIFIRNNTL